ncbi:hypothetical protein B0A49_09719 [Cryomyces minteri]|uniref:Shugoshin C-terminal domain-containing protein n=1 Tax=Cryomyces minteri TaxID=331657 RepID=A0A4U0VYY2_9PEZI|nr:hypothetical protein B0A49_09719 [Cryomyces minteri]
MAYPGLVKRRFVRQNRELAKNNSTQSLRIRALEAETSRLLAENISLREQIIHLQSELESNQDASIAKTVSTVKTQLEERLQEIGGLIAELGISQNPPSKANRKSRSAQRSPDQKEWKNKPSLAETTCSEGRLPTITEDKHYPRRTLEPEDLRVLRLSDQSNESPDLGPPPVAHFDYEDPIKFDPKPTPKHTEDNGVTTTEDLPVSLSANLETRKKRRDSHARLEIRRTSAFAPLAPEDAEPLPAATQVDRRQPLKAGAKRKLSAREDGIPATVTGEDDFRFSRKPGTAGVGNADGQQSVHPAFRAEPVENDDLRGAEEVSVNISPRKLSIAASGSSKDDVQKPAPSARDNRRNQAWERRPRVPSNDRAAPAAVAVNLVEIPAPPLTVAEHFVPQPETPAGLDFLSPTSTDAASARPESKDTPPPGDLNPVGTLGDIANAANRPSRRARAAVSYAEPNLVSKMRRPTKDLVDVVGRGGKDLNDGELNEVEGAATNAGKAGMRKVVIKREEPSGSVWKKLPLANNHDQPSPLSKKTAAEAPAQQPTQDQHRTAEVIDKRSSSTAAISALMTGSRSKKDVAPAEQSTDLEAALEQLDIYDFNESSPIDHTTGTGANVDARSRRRSSVPTPISTLNSSSTAKAQAVDKHAAGVKSTHNRVGSRRQTMETSGLKNVEEPDRSKFFEDIKSARGISGLGEGIGGAGGRSERATARRKSMLL